MISVHNPIQNIDPNIIQNITSVLRNFRQHLFFYPASYYNLPTIIQPHFTIVIMARKELSPDIRSVIYKLSTKGLTHSEIGSYLDITKSTVNTTLCTIRKKMALGVEDPFKSSPRSGRKPILSPRDQRALIRFAQKNRAASLDSLGHKAIPGKTISICTVRKELKKRDYSRRKARKKFKVTFNNQIKRKSFAKSHKQTDWTQIIWSDECYIRTSSLTQNIWVTRKSGEEWDADCMQETEKSSGVSVCVWACFIGGTKGPFLILPPKPTLTQQTYFQNIWLDHFLLFYIDQRKEKGPEICMQEDNASWHKGHEKEEWMDAWDINGLSWPPQSPDLSPIENIWKVIKNKMSMTERKYKNWKQLGAAAKEAWDQLQPEDFMKYVGSIPRRIQAVERSDGKPTKY